MHFGIFGLTRNQKTFGDRALPGPAGEGYVLPKPQAGFFGRREGERRGRKWIRGGEGVGRKGKGTATGILREGRHVAKYGTAGEYRLG